jgi:hypothetical protein
MGAVQRYGRARVPRLSISPAFFRNLIANRRLLATFCIDASRWKEYGGSIRRRILLRGAAHVTVIPHDYAPAANARGRGASLLV